MKSMMRSLKNDVMKYDEAERRIREATSNDPDFCNTDLMLQIVEDIKDADRYRSTVDMLSKRMQDYAYLNHVLKSLILIEFLLRHAENNFIRDMTAKLDIFKKLRGYKCYDNAQNEIGGDARRWATSIVKLLEDPTELERRRIVAHSKRDGVEDEAKGGVREQGQHEGEEEEEEEEEDKPKQRKSPKKQDFNDDEQDDEEKKKKKKSPKKKIAHAADDEENDEEEEEVKPKKKTTPADSLEEEDDDELQAKVQKKKSPKKAPVEDQAPKPRTKKKTTKTKAQDDEDTPPKPASKQSTSAQSPDNDFDDFLSVLDEAPKAQPQSSAAASKSQLKSDPLDFLFQ